MSLLLSLAILGCGAAQPVPDHTTKPLTVVTFKVRIENVSKMDAIKAPGGGRQGVAMSPGVFAVHALDGPFFTTSEPDRGKGLEAIAEDGNPAMLAKHVPLCPGVLSSGTFTEPVGATAAGPIGPGGAFEFTLAAVPGTKLSFATMFGQSNDLFFAPGDGGIPLFDADHRPVAGDVTAQVQLWDAGTEVNQEPGTGSDQGPLQKGPDMGAPERKPICIVEDAFTYPAVREVLKVTLAPLQPNP